jgi:23S rRNA (guanosine2251-2'-O)-methyltransferase
VARASRETQGLRSLLAAADRAGVPVKWVEGSAVADLGGASHQGVAALVTLPSVLDERELATRSFSPNAVAVVLDGITDPHNLGACARSAEAAGAAVLVIRKDRAATITAAAIRASAGALLHIPVARVTNLVRSIDRLKEQGFTVVGLDSEGRSMSEAPPPGGPTALIVGSEGTGLSRLVREHCDVLVSIPMHGRTESLNASAALAVGLFGYAVRS